MGLHTDLPREVTANASSCRIDGGLFEKLNLQDQQLTELWNIAEGSVVMRELGVEAVEKLEGEEGEVKGENERLMGENEKLVGLNEVLQNSVSDPRFSPILRFAFSDLWSMCNHYSHFSSSKPTEPTTQNNSTISTASRRNTSSSRPRSRPFKNIIASS